MRHDPDRSVRDKGAGGAAASLPSPLHLRSLAETERLAARLAASARIGDVLGLCGPLGSGKTAFARAFIRARTGRPDEEVPSPTFTLAQTYEHESGTVWHFDLYRIREATEAHELGLEEAFATGLSLIEWPERLGDALQEDWLELRLTAAGADNERWAVLASHGPRSEALGRSLG